MGFMRPKPVTQTQAVQWINTKGWVDSPYISHDGSTLWFMYARYNFWPVFTGGKPVLQGPERIGHHNNDLNPWGDSDIYYSTRNDSGGWSTPLNWHGNDYDSNASMQPLPSTNPTVMWSADGDICTQTLSNGVWGSDNYIAALNSQQTEDNPWVSDDGTLCFFTSNRPGGVGTGKNIWWSFFSNGAWSAPVNAGSPINVSGVDSDQFFYNVGTEAFYNQNSQIYRTTWNGSGWDTPTLVDLGLPFVAEPSTPSDGKTLYFVNADPTTKRNYIMSAKRIDTNTWEKPVPVDVSPI